MQHNENCRGARNRIMILVYITWLTLSLAPAMVAPPERGFVQGQPEMQQAMDNMVAHKTIVSKRITSSNNGADYHAVLTSKTSNLLAEAEQVLSSLPNSKERHGIEAFIQRMKAIATMLDKTVQNKNLARNTNVVNGTPVPEGLPLQPTWPATSAVPGINPFQKVNKMMSKFPVTSPELSKVLPANEYPSERQAVTKPAILSNNKVVEEDELVRELESLHQEYSKQIPLQNSKVLGQSPVLTTPSTPMSPESSTVKMTDAEAELQARLIQDVKEFQRLGIVIPKEFLDALYTHSQKPTVEIPTAEPAYDQTTNTDHKVKLTQPGMVDKYELQRLDDLKNEDKGISETNHQNSVLQNIPYQDNKELSQMKLNPSFQSMPPNFHPNLQTYLKQIGNHFHHMSPQNREYQEGVQNEMQGFDKQSPGRYQNQGRYHAMAVPPNQRMGHMPETLRQMLSKSQNNFHNGHLIPGYNEYLMKHGYQPQPYMHKWDPKNSTHHQPPMLSSYLTKESMTHQIDTQLSDEMKRQLRDGKIIVLSDSVVRSNFETSNGEGTTKSTTDTTDSEDSKNVPTIEN